MAFIQPCFIRKNTPELRKKLEELGYRYCSTFDEKAPYLWLGEGVIYDTFNVGITIIEVGEYLGPYGISCGSNEELFLALAALRDDTDINQWFIYNSMDCIIEKLRTIDWFICEENSIEDFAYYDSLYLNCHKATAEEIIEHFKKD